MKKQTPKDLTGKDRHQLYLYFGDEFLVKEEVRGVVERTLDPDLRDTNFIILDGNSLDVSSLSTQLFTPSLFGESRVILVDQTTIFMSKTDQTKLVAKVIDSWKSGDKRTALKHLGQVLALAGVDSERLRRGNDWVGDVLSDSRSAEDGETFLAAARAFLEEERKVGSGGDEALVEEIMTSPFPEGTVLVFTAPGVDRRKKVFKAVEKHGRVVECAVREEKYGTGLDKKYFEDRVRDSINSVGKKIGTDALAAIYARSGKELRRLHSELEKLIGYVGDRAEITVQDVEALFSDFHEAGAFDLTNALRTADITKCLPALHENLRIVSHPLQTLGLIAADFRKLIVARELLFSVFKSSWKPGMTYQAFVPVAAKVRQENPSLTTKGKFNLLSMKDYPLYLLLKDAQKFPMEKLLKIMEAILHVDVMMKSSSLGSRAPEALLEELVHIVCSPATPGRVSNRRSDRQTHLA